MLTTLTRVGLLVLLVALFSSGGKAGAQEIIRPQIVEAHLGLGGYYKVGCWTPLTLQLRGGSEPLVVSPRVRVRDGEGLITAFRGTPFELGAGQERRVEILVRVGQLDAPVEVELVAEGHARPVASRTFDPDFPGDDRTIEPGDAATALHVVEVGGSVGLKLASSQESANQEFVVNRLAHVDSVDLLPRHYLAYEGVDTVLLATSDRNQWAALRSDDPRLRALTQWVELGGRLILFCGRNSPELLGADGPLRELAPGTFSGMITMTDFRQLELYSGSNERFPGLAQAQLGVPHLRDVNGNVELTVTQEDVTIPLVVRKRFGLGQVVFAGFDPDVGDFQKWSSREGVLTRLMALRDETLGSDQNNFYYYYAEDLSGLLHNSLEKRLENAGVRTPPFLWIAGLVLLYILLIGPGDYLLVRYGLKRMEWTWVTFPMIVILTSGGAYWLADYLKGRDRLINQIELVDVDTTRGLVRGTLWSQVFSPQPDSYTLSLSAQLPSGSGVTPQDEAVAWLGKPAEGIGGMNTSAGGFWGRTAYGWTPDRETMAGVPIEVWSTKTFVARWHAPAQVDLETNLSRTAADGVTGTITNSTGVDLKDATLVYGEMTWVLGDLAQGASFTIDPPSVGNRSQSPRKLRTRLEQRYNLATDEQAYIRAQRISSVPLHGLVELMMFSDLAGGRRLTGSWNRYQDFVDLSHTLDNDTAAIYGRTSTPRSELLRNEGGGPPTSMRGPRDTAEVVYRFFVPVGPIE
jgi:hypothetical protein